MNIRRSLCVALLAGPLSLIGGCSLTKLVDVRVGECSGDNEEGHRRCQEVLNPEYGFYEGCAAFKCVELDDYFQCQQVDGEVCDGQDNDCDYLIDEPNDNKTQLVAKSSDLASGIEKVSSISLSESELFGSSIYFQESEGELFQVALDGESSSTTEVTLRTQKQSPNVNSKAAFLELQDGCYPAGSNTVGTCTFDQTVTAAGDEVAFFAYVNSSGCTSGELRVGIMEQARPDDFIDRGLGTRAPSYRGVHTQGSRCSGNLTDACEELKAQDEPDNAKLSKVCGVSEPALAALPNQALVTYLGTQLSASQCPTSDANVLSILIHQSVDAFEKTFSWGNPSGDGAPELIGSTRSGTAPAVAPLAGKGFLVAHGNAKGGIRLVWVPRQAAPKKVMGTSCPSGDCDSREGVETKSLQDVVELVKLDAGGTTVADGLSVSVLDYDEDQAAVLLTWVDGCALDRSNLNLGAKAQLLHVDISGDEPEIKKEFAVVSLGQVGRPPVATPSNDEFVVPGFKRNDEKASSKTAGGFYVFVESSSPHVVRLANFDGALVDKGEQISTSDWTYLMPLASGSIAALDTGAGKLKKLSVSCGD